MRFKNFSKGNTYFNAFINFNRKERKVLAEGSNQLIAVILHLQFNGLFNSREFSL